MIEMEQTKTFGAFGSVPPLAIGLMTGVCSGPIGGIFAGRKKRKQDHQARGELWDAYERMIEALRQAEKPKWPPRHHPRSPRKRKG